MTNGTKVFIAGSRRLSRLNNGVKRRIDKIVEKGFAVLVGDANGADKAVQRYLHSKSYNSVIVFCMEGACRNNIGQWPTRTIKAADPTRRNFAYYSAKDRAMVDEADYGLMLWDGRSRGTLRSIVQLVQQGKPVLVYTSADKSFSALRQPNDLAKVLGHVDTADLYRLDPQLQHVQTGGDSSRRVETALLF